MRVNRFTQAFRTCLSMVSTTHNVWPSKKWSFPSMCFWILWLVSLCINLNPTIRSPADWQPSYMLLFLMGIHFKVLYLGILQMDIRFLVSALQTFGNISLLSIAKSGDLTFEFYDLLFLQLLAIWYCNCKSSSFFSIRSSHTHGFPGPGMAVYTLQQM
jgi:hypothetical protein